jgi:hypothetical protein
MKRPSAPLVISLVALFFSLSGAGLAAQHYLGTAHTSATARFTTVYGKSASLCGYSTQRQCWVGASTAACPRYTTLIGGGWVPGKGGTGGPTSSAVGFNGPVFPGAVAWFVEIYNEGTLADGSFQAVATCAR